MFRTRLLLQFNRTSFPWIIVPVLFFLTVVLVESICILHINGSIFYTQDDPYIHLALSEKIAEFHYGINIGEPSAPSSSILWPFLLAAFARFTWHPLVPLAVNIAAQATTMAMLYRTMDLSFGSTQPVLSAVASILIAWCSGQIAPVFTGLEHNLHTSLTVASILGLIILNQQHRLPRWFLFVLVIAPLVRYEAAALSLMSIVMIWMRGHGRSATIVLILCVLLLGGFSAFLKTEGLPLLPGSVLVKLNENLDHGNSYALTLIKTLNLRLAQANERGVLLGLCLTILGWVLTGRGGWLTAVTSCVCLLHFIFGAWVERYLVHLLSIVLISAIYITAPQISLLSTRRGTMAATQVLLIASTPLLMHPASALLKVPGGARDVRLQQTEMHRFVVNYWKKPVAVNDIGQVSYHNPFYVLDLWGLSSEDARAARQRGERDWALGLLSRNNVQLAMVFDAWLGSAIPPSWVRLGTLNLDVKPATALYKEVAFYADPRAVSQLTGLLREFADTMPTGASFTFTTTSLQLVRPPSIKDTIRVHAEQARR
jgi:hypothetical protein